MKYTILRTERFNDQLNDILNYIADDSGDIDAALNVLTRMEEAILRLHEFPDSGGLPRYTVLKRQGYRVLLVMRWLVFYKVNHETHTVMLYAIVDQRQEYVNLL